MTSKSGAEKILIHSAGSGEREKKCPVGSSHYRGVPPLNIQVRSIVFKDFFFFLIL